MRNPVVARCSAAFVVLVLLISVITGNVAAQSSGPISQSFSLSTVGQRLPTLTLNGQIQSCSIVIYNSGGGFTITPQAASDGIGNPTPSWVTATSINTGSISTTGTFTGNVSGQGLTSFGGVLSALTSGTITGVETCSAAAGSGQSVAVSSLPPVNVNNAPTVQPSCAAANYPCGLPTPPATTTVSGTITGTGATSAVSTVGMNSCQATFTGTGTATVQWQGTSDAVPTWTGMASGFPITAPTVNNINTTSTSANASALLQIRLTVSVYGGTAIPYTITCSTANSDISFTSPQQVTFSTAQPVLVPTVSPSPQGMAGVPAPQVWAGQMLGRNGALGTWDIRQAAPSPAPSGIPASMYNNGGAAVPIYGTTLITNACANITTATTTLCRALSGTTKIFVTSYVITSICTATCSVQFESGTQTTNPCDTGTTTLSWQFWFPSGSGQISSAPGLGLALPPSSAGQQLCVVTTGTITDITVFAMGAQF